jgi:DNA ligase (NAD+)
MPGKNITELIKLIQADYKKQSQKLSISDLVKVLKKLSDVYYNTGESLVSDLIYDELRDTLEERDPENPFLEEVGAPVKGTKNKVKLPFAMGSLTKIKPDTGALDKWSKKYKGPYIVSDKLDGASVQLYKDKKGNTMLYSRGKSIEGQDISHLIPYVTSKNSIKNLPNNTSVRGELIISKKNFEKVSSYLKNARNAVSGLVNSKTVDMKVAKLTELVTYAVLYPRDIQSHQMKLLEKCEFNVVPYKKVKKLDENTMKKYLLERKNDSKYEMDGLVCVDDSDIYEETGGYPDYAFAFKMLLDDQTAIATIVKILWDPSMDGYIKPTIEIKPIELIGVTVTYATAHNAKFIVDNNLGPGAKIKIVRSGDVIPYILEVVKEATSGKPQMPPYEYEWNETEVDLIVKNPDENIKKTIIIKQMIHFFSAMKIKYLSEGIITKLVNNGYDTIPKILKAKKEKLSKIEGLGDKMVTKIYGEIDKAFDEVDLQTFVGASHKFGRGLGRRKMEEVLNIYPNILSQNWSKREMVDKILEVPGFALKLAQLFADNFADFKKFYDEISKIKDISRFVDVESSDDDNSESEEQLLDGEKIVFTGFRDSDLEKCIKKMGGKVSSTVSGNTTILVHKDDADQSVSKFQKAKEKGTKIISQSAFIKKYCSDYKK